MEPALKALKDELLEDDVGIIGLHGVLLKGDCQGEGNGDTLVGSMLMRTLYSVSS